MLAPLIQSSVQSEYVQIGFSQGGLCWRWELRSRDGHSLSCSADFDDRYACELDALQQGLPVKGLSRKLSRALKNISVASDPK